MFKSHYEVRLNILILIDFNLTLNVVHVSHRRHHRLMHAASRGEHQWAHRLRRVLHYDPRVALLDLIVPVAVHADDAVVDRALALRQHRRLLHQAELLVLYH